MLLKPACGGVRRAISPFGGAKGYALGLAFGVLVAALTGTATGRDVTETLDEEHPTTKGDALICFDPAALGRAGSDIRTADYLDAVRATPAVDAMAPVTIPGDRARTVRDERTQDGISVDGSLWQTLTDLVSTPPAATA